MCQETMLREDLCGHGEGEGVGLGHIQRETGERDELPQVGARASDVLPRELVLTHGVSFPVLSWPCQGVKASVAAAHYNWITAVLPLGKVSDLASGRHATGT
jgi:hypothetical protein